MAQRCALIPRQSANRATSVRNLAVAKSLRCKSRHGDDPSGERRGRLLSDGTTLLVCDRGWLDHDQITFLRQIILNGVVTSSALLCSVFFLPLLEEVQCSDGGCVVRLGLKKQFGHAFCGWGRGELGINQRRHAILLPNSAPAPALAPRDPRTNYHERADPYSVAPCSFRLYHETPFITKL